MTGPFDWFIIITSAFFIQSEQQPSKNIESLTTEIYKFQACLIPSIMCDLIVTREKNIILELFKR